MNGWNVSSAQENSFDFPPAELAAIEQLAAELAGLAGAEILSAFGSAVSVRYKPVAGDALPWRDPVSAVADRVESLIRERIAAHFPEHDIIGEESNERPGRGHDIIWAIDPTDGTANFVNGFPISPTMGLGQSLAAPRRLSCRARGPLTLGREDVIAPANPVRCCLAGVPRSGQESELWDTRTLGSAALDCAMVAAGCLQVARFFGTEYLGCRRWSCVGRGRRWRCFTPEGVRMAGDA